MRETRKVTCYSGHELRQGKGTQEKDADPKPHHVLVEYQKVKDFLDASSEMFQKVLADKFFEDPVKDYLIRMMEFKLYFLDHTKNLVEQPSTDSSSTNNCDTK